jgi:NTP pyrophosphatase (non-canonical NTP hydrolase)
MPNNTKSFQEIVEINKSIIAEFEKQETRPWGVEGSLIELTKQVGDLSKRIMVMEKYYTAKRLSEPKYVTTTFNVGDELADIFLFLVRIAKYYQIDLESTILSARKRELEYLGKKADF